MIDAGATVLAAELDIGQILEWLVIAALYFLLSAGSERLRRKKAEQDAEAHETRPDFEPTETWEPEPPPPRPVDLSEPVEPPRPPEAARRPVEAPEPVAARAMASERLEVALARWRKAAEPHVGQAGAERLVDAVKERLPAWGGGAPWTSEDAADADEVVGVVDDLTAAVGAVSHPAERILWRCAEAMLDPVARQGRGAQADRPPVLVPVGRAPTAEAEMLAADADLLPLEVPEGAPPPARRVSALEEVTARVLTSRPRALDAVLSRALTRLADDARESGRVSRLLRVLVRQEMVGSLLASGVVSAIVFRHTGPLAVLSEPSMDPATLTSRGLRAALARRAADRSRLAAPSPPAEEVEAQAWERVAEAVEGAMADVSWGAGPGPGLWTLVPAWGPAEDQAADDLQDALSSRRRELGARPSAAAALVAWHIAEAESGVPFERRTLSPLADAVEGRRPPSEAPLRRLGKAARPTSLPAEAPRRPDVLVLQIVLGAPRARRHPAFRKGPRPVWRSLSPPAARRG